jgi:short-subunit dehydrogenase
MQSNDKKKEGFSPKCHTLGLDDQSTIIKFRDFIKENYGGIDVLVNNAGIAYKVGFVHVQVSEWLLFNTNLAIFQLYHGENKLIFNEMMMMRSALF